jgi:hypothetical protein
MIMGGRQAMIRPSAEDINAIVDTTREWPADARARLIERLKAADAGRSSGAIKVAGGPTAAEVIARFGQQGPGPSDETVRAWIREHKEAQGGQ